MRVVFPLLVIASFAGPVAAQQSPAGSSSSSGTQASSPAVAQSQDEQRPQGNNGQAAAGTNSSSPGLPVSLDRIRGQLQQSPAQTLRGLHEEAMFKVQIQERQRIEELLATLDFKSGPTPAGGVYAYELQRITKPPIDNPLSQPYAAFSTSELLTIAVENLAVKYLGGRALSAVTAGERQRAEQAARDEVARSMAEFCAAQPNNGAGISACQFGPR
jgi:hypothetical protein